MKRKILAQVNMENMNLFQESNKKNIRQSLKGKIKKSIEMK